MMVGMDQVGRMLDLVSIGVDDQELLAELGKVVVNSTVLEYTIATLVAQPRVNEATPATSGLSRSSNRQVGRAASSGAWPRSGRTLRGFALRRRNCSPGKNSLVHSLTLGHGKDDGQYVMAIYNPRRNTETVVTTHVVARHAKYFKQNTARSGVLSRQRSLTRQRDSGKSLAACASVGNTTNPVLASRSKSCRNGDARATGWRRGHRGICSLPSASSATAPSSCS